MIAQDPRVGFAAHAECAHAYVHTIKALRKPRQLSKTSQSARTLKLLQMFRTHKKDSCQARYAIEWHTFARGGSYMKAEYCHVYMLKSPPV